MWKKVRTQLFWWFVGLLNGGIIVSATAEAMRRIDISKAGVSLWIFIVVGTIVILLQLVPAIILFAAVVGHFAKVAQEAIPIKDKYETPQRELDMGMCCHDISQNDDIDDLDMLKDDEKEEDKEK